MTGREESAPEIGDPHQLWPARWNPRDRRPDVRMTSDADQVSVTLMRCLRRPVPQGPPRPEGGRGGRRETFRAHHSFRVCDRVPRLAANAQHQTRSA